MIIIKSERDLETMRPACAVASAVLEEVAAFIQPGVTTQQVNEFAASRIAHHGARSAFLGYRKFPCHLCISVNEQVVHGLAGSRQLCFGDIVSLCVLAGISWQAPVVAFGIAGVAAAAMVFATVANSQAHAPKAGAEKKAAAKAVAVGGCGVLAQKLMDVSEQALYEGIAQALPGKRVVDISRAIQNFVESNGFSVVREFVGHGVGRTMHEEPQVPNFVDGKTTPRLRPGMTLAIEPMVAAGLPAVKILNDGWTVVTQDGSLSAHFEHTVLVTEGEPEVLTWPERMLSRLRVP